jgi:hypothetical protein
VQPFRPGGASAQKKRRPTEAGRPLDPETRRVQCESQLTTARYFPLLQGVLMTLHICGEAPVLYSLQTGGGSVMTK